MKSNELYKLINEELLPKCMEIMKSKGEAYSGQEDKLGNFKRCAQLSNQAIEKVWFIYFVKHFDALSAYIRGEYKDSESIEGRIKDLINYLFLLYAIIREKQENIINREYINKTWSTTLNGEEITYTCKEEVENGQDIK